MAAERLQKILARAGIASRRAAEQLISQGRVTVDGRPVTEMGLQLDAAQHRIEFDGKPISPQEKKVYILLNKPVNYLSTLRDPQGRPIVTSLLKGVTARVFPVGRLDFDTEGALLLTNDGELAQKILHPRHEVDKTYEARVAGHPDRPALSRLAAGIELEGRKTWPARLRVVGSRGPETTISITIHEGRKRQVRKMFAAVGHRVLALKRVAYGNLQLGRLAPGQFRYLAPQDIALIFSKNSSLQ